MKRRWLPKWVSGFQDRHGKARYRFRRKGQAQYLFKHAPGTEEFRQEYQACLTASEAPRIQPGADKVKPGTFDDLIVRYYRSPDFLDPSPRTQVVYRGVIERWRAKYGSGRVADLETRHVAAMMAEMLPHRTSANMLRKRLSALMAFANRQGDIDKNPVLATKPYRIDGGGFHTWTEPEIAQYEAHHPTGTMARLMFDLLLWTGQRGGDVRLLGPNAIQDKRLIITQEKTKVTVSLPILPALAQSILATQTGEDTFLVTTHGKTFTRKGFGNKFRDWCDAAGLNHCSAHGLRKAAARRFAEARCSNQQIKAWTGHTTDSEIARYTAAVDQQLMSDAAAEMLLANLIQRVSQKSSQAPEKG
jgi:integrase